MLAKTGAGHFHELENVNFFAVNVRAPECPQGQAKCGGAFAFAIAGVDDDQATPFAFGAGVCAFGGWIFDLHFWR